MLAAPASPFDYNSVPVGCRGELRAQAASIRAQVKVTVLAIIKTGRALIEVKSKLEHGQFSAWVQSECGFTLRTAENYINVAAFAEGKNETVSLLPPSAVYKLAAKSTPSALVQSVMERVESGTPVNATEIAAALAEARFQKREADRKAREAERRRKKSKPALAREEAGRQAEEKRRQQEEENLRLQAVSLIDAIGEDHARMVVEALSDKWHLLEHLRREISDREAVVEEKIKAPARKVKEVASRPPRMSVG